METLEIIIGKERFAAAFEDEAAPELCKAFRSLLPFNSKLVHARWSGEACWIPLGSFKLDVDYESATSHPLPGQLLFYPGGLSETEILLPYGPASFACRAGQLAGSPLIRITDRLDKLAALGAEILWKGAQDIIIRTAGNESDGGRVSC